MFSTPQLRNRLFALRETVRTWQRLSAPGRGPAGDEAEQGDAAETGTNATRLRRLEKRIALCRSEVASVREKVEQLDVVREERDELRARNEALRRGLEEFDASLFE
jgi:hypothetical protein